MQRRKFIVVLVDIDTGWFGEIVGFFEKRTTSGVVEGINNKLKLIKRSGFGFTNFNNFKLRSLMAWHYSIDLAR